VRQTVGNTLDSHIHILAIGSAGGLLLAWKSQHFETIHTNTTTYTIMADLRLKVDNTEVKVITVYDPSNAPNRETFFREML
jgi:hypothetical protein